MNNSSISAFLAPLKKGEKLSEKQVIALVQKAEEVLSTLDNLISVHMPITVCGDVHGQLYDLIELFKIGGEVPETSYLFLGDYVDRGCNSVETIELILTLKVLYPNQIHILRGNHENKDINKQFGFYDECLMKYGTPQVWRQITDLFQYLPICAVVENQYYCCHGGLSPDLASIDQIKMLNRKQEIPHQGPLCDVMWSDPEEGIKGWQQNSRGAGFAWGVDASEEFTHKNNLDSIIRAHQLVMQGYLKNHNEKCLTIFSAPNYCYRCGNSGGFVEIDDHGQQNLQIFDPAPRQDQASITRRVPSYFL